MVNLAKAMRPHRRATLNDRDSFLWELLTGSKLANASGEVVNSQTALGIAAYYAAIRNSAEDCAKLPMKLYKRVDPAGKGHGKEEQRRHPAWVAVHDRPNPFMTPSNFWESIHVGSRGWSGGYAEIVKQNDGSIELYPIEPNRVQKALDRANQRWVYQVTMENGTPMPFSDDQILELHGVGLEGLTQWTISALGTDSLGGMLAVQRHAAAFFKNGAISSGYLKTLGAMEDDALKRLRESFDERHTGAENHYRPMILEEGLEWVPISVDPEKSQLQAIRDGNVREIARWFRMPLHKLGDLSDAKYANITQENLNYYTDHLLTWLNRIEQECNRKLLTEEERAAGYFFRHNIRALLRASPQEQAQAHQIYHSMAVLNADEIRDDLDMNPKDDGTGKVYGINSAWQPVDAIIKKAALEIEKMENPPEPPPVPVVAAPDSESDPDSAPDDRKLPVKRLREAHYELIRQQVAHLTHMQGGKLARIRDNGTLDTVSDTFWDRTEEEYNRRMSVPIGVLNDTLSMITGARRAQTVELVGQMRQKHVEWSRAGVFGASRDIDETEMILDAVISAYDKEAANV